MALTWPSVLSRAPIASAVCVASCVIGQASAQTSLTIYGRVDVSLQMKNRSLTDDSSYTIVHTGGIRPSIWGLRGIEDLGGGLKVLFNLEGQFDSSTGEQMSQPGNSQTFRHQANVGLRGDWGMLQLGRLYSPLVWATGNVEPRTWKEQFSQIGQLANNQLSGPGNPLGAGSNDSNDVGTFIGNAVLYSHTLGAFYVGIGYGFGKQPDDFGKGSQVAIGISYTGPVTIGFGYHKVKDSVSGVTIHDFYDLGAAISRDDATLRLNYIHARSKPPATGGKVSDVGSLGLGADYKWGADHTTTVACYYNRYDSDPGDSTTKSLVISNDLALSKRTVLYAQLAYEDSDASVNPADPLEYLKRTIVVGGTPPAGKETGILSLGIMLLMAVRTCPAAWSPVSHARLVRNRDVPPCGHRARAVLPR